MSASSSFGIIPEVQFKKHLPQLQNYDASLSFEERRDSNIESNRECLASLGLLTPKPKVPRVTKKVISPCDLPLITKRVVHHREGKKNSGGAENPKSAKWQCPDCPSSFPPGCLTAYIDHIQKVHQIDIVSSQLGASRFGYMFVL